MELIIIARIVRRWGWLALIPVAITTALALPGLLARGASGGFVTSITYSAAQQFSAIPRTEGDYQDIWLSSELTVNAFTDWIRASRFRDEIAVALADPSLDLSGLGIAADNARSVGRIDLSYPDADGLRAIREAVITVLSTRSADYFAQLGDEPARVTLLGQTPIAASPAPIGDRVTPLLRIGIGLAAGIVIMLLAYAFDPRLHTRAELNEAGVPVLGTIPRR